MPFSRAEDGRIYHRVFDDHTTRYRDRPQSQGGVGADDPDAQFYENYACGSQRNYTGYCNPDLQKMFEQQSMEADQEKRKRLVWEIDRRLQED